MKPIRHIRPRAVVLAENKAAAEKLRNEGYNYKEIAHIIGVPKSTVHSWFSLPAKKAAENRTKTGTQLKLERDLLKDLQKANREIAMLRKELRTRGMA